MAKQKSITQRIKSATHQSTRVAIGKGWILDKRSEISSAKQHLESSVGNGDLHEMHLALDKYEDIAIKSYNAMGNMIDAIAYPLNQINIELNIGNPEHKALIQCVKDDLHSNSVIIALLLAHYGVSIDD